MLESSIIRGKDVDEALKELPHGISTRLGNNEQLEKFVYDVFYAGSIAHARKFLVIAIQRYLLDLPLISEDEERENYLSTLSPEERAAWWKDYNRTKKALEEAK